MRVWVLYRGGSWVLCLDEVTALVDVSQEKLKATCAIKIESQRPRQAAELLWHTCCTRVGGEDTHSK